MSALLVARYELIVARYELIGLGRDRRVLGAALCLLVLLAAALVSSAETRRHYERTRSDAQEASYRQWLTQGAKNPHSAAHFGTYAFRPLPDLAAFEPGEHLVSGTSVYLEPHKTNELRDAPDDDTSTPARIGSSAAVLLRTVFPLIVFALAAASLAGERERGTSKLLAAQGLSPTALFIGKSIAFATLLLAVFAAAGIVALASARWAATDLARTAWLAVGYGLYAVLTLVVGLAVSAVAKTARSAFVALFFTWTLACLAGPRIAASAAGAIAPMPLRSDVQRDLARDLDHDGGEAREAALREELLRTHGVTTVEALPFDFAGASLAAEEERGDAIFDRHMAALQARAREQDAWLDRASVLVPWLALERWSTALAGTDGAHTRRFTDAAEAHRRDLVGRMNRYQKEHGKEAGFGLVADASLWSTVPAFRYEAPSAGFALAYAWPALAVLVAWTALAIALSLRFVRRTSVLGGDA